MRPQWNGAFLQMTAGLVEFPCGRGFAVQRGRHPSADRMCQAPAGANEDGLSDAARRIRLAKAVFRHTREPRGVSRLAPRHARSFDRKMIPLQVELAPDDTIFGVRSSRKGGSSL